MYNFKDKKILVIGYARSGKASVNMLLHLGAQITVYDKKVIDSGKDFEFLRENNVGIINDTHEAEFEKKWDLVVKSPGIPYKAWFILKLQEQNVDIISEIELGYMVTKQHKYIAITGTNGKTTTTTLTYEIMKKHAPDTTYIAGNIGIPLCEVILQNELIKRENCVIVLEISNYQLMDIKEFKPYVSTIINMSPDHLDHIDTLEEYYESKVNVYKNASDTDLFILNVDDKVVKEYTEKFPINCAMSKFSFFDKSTLCYLDGDDIVYSGDKIIDINKLILVGRHSIQNVMVAVSIVKHLNVSDDIIREVCYGFGGVEHRIEFVREIAGVNYYNDSKATNVDATETALKSFERNIILLIGGFEKNLDVTPLRAYFDRIKHVIGFGDCGKRLIDELNFAESVIEKNLFTATMKAYELSKSGDTVLLSPTTSSFDEFSCFEERGEKFKEIVNGL